MIKKFIFILLLFIVCSYIVSAEKVAYVTTSNSNPEQRYVDILENMGFVVEVVKDNNITNTNFSKYLFLLIGNGYLDNADSLPVNRMPSLILNTYHLDNFHWSSTSGALSSSGILQVYINDPTNPITKSFPSIVDTYNRSTLSYHYLPKGYKSVYLKTLASPTFDHVNSVIATAEPGTKLRDNVYSSSKGVFFGIDENNYWTNYSKQLFINSINWLIVELIPPEISNIRVMNITNDSAVISWDTNKDSNSSVSYGRNGNLSLVKANSSFTKTHNLVLNNLEGDTIYYYNVKSCTSNAYCSNTGVLEFSTLDLINPKLISVQISNITNSSALVSASVDELSDITVFVGNNESSLNEYISVGPSTSFNFALNNLKEKMQYFYQLEICDVHDNCANSSIYNFTTLDLTAPNAPENLILQIVNNDQIKFTWSMLAGEDVDHYNVYIIGDNDVDFNLSKPYASTTLTEYTDTNTSDDKQRYYTVESVDTSGNKRLANDVVKKVDLNLTKGYNLVSLPLIPFDNSISAVMHQNNNYNPIREIRRFDNLNKIFEEVNFNEATSEWQGDFNTLDEIDGYFFFSDENIIFTVVGQADKITKHVNLVKGMNLIGLALDEDKQLEGAITQSPTNYNVTEISYMNSDGTYGIITYYPSEGWFGTVHPIKAGEAYWIKANKNFRLRVDS